MTQANTSFESANPETLELLETFNYEKRCTFLTSSNYMHADTAKLGYLLSAILTRAHRATTPYRTFFVNSSLEALSGAIKLVRQTSVPGRKSDDGWILLVDEGNRFAPFLDPTGRGEQAGTTPDVRFAGSVAAALPMVGEHKWSGLIHLREPAAADPGTRPASDAQEALLRLVDSARRQGALIVAVDSELDLGSAAFSIHGYAPDVVVYGENLTERQVPFGCFTMTEKAHLVRDHPRRHVRTSAEADSRCHRRSKRSMRLSDRG